MFAECSSFENDVSKPASSPGFPHIIPTPRRAQIREFTDNCISLYGSVICDLCCICPPPSWPNSAVNILSSSHPPLVCSAFQVDVIVELRPLEDGAILHRNVVLLLKCAKSVNWDIKAHGLTGKLDVVVR